MRNLLIGFLIALLLFFIYKGCENKQNESRILAESSVLIQKQIDNVSKLVVTEGHFAEVYNFKETEGLFGNLITTRKTALVVVNADVQVSYDLAKLKYEIDSENKRLVLKSLPEPEIKINPDLEYYDVTGDYLNPFNAQDYNDIKDRVNKKLMIKINRSDMLQNAQNRLISELSKFYILTNSLGWTLSYNEKVIEDPDMLNLPEIKN